MNTKRIFTSLVFSLAMVFPVLGFAENREISFEEFKTRLNSLPKQENDPNLGQMKNEHLIVEYAQIQVLPSANNLSRGIVTFRCGAEACPLNQVNYGPQTIIYDPKEQVISSDRLISFTGKKAGAWLKRGETEAEIIRIYP